MVPFVYRLDDQDRLVHFGTGADFDATAGGLALTPLLGRSLWSCIGEGTTQDLYRQLIKRARAGRRMRVHYRCDDAAHRRWFEMVIVAVPGGEVECTSHLLKEELRPSVALLEPGQERTADLVRMCSWCQRFAVSEDRWLPVEEAADALHLLERQHVPRITHGICPDCFRRVNAEAESWGDGPLLPDQTTGGG